MGLFKRQSEPQVVIDLREQVPARTSVPRFGSPVPCPECSGRGYLDHIDPYAEIMFLHCTQCGARYERSKVELTRVDS